MKKLMLALFAVAALVSMDADARFRRGCCATEEVKNRCCERVEEAPCGKPPCCVKYKKVTEPATRVKHIEYKWECPADCDMENAIAAQS